MKIKHYNIFLLCLKSKTEIITNGNGSNNYNNNSSNNLEKIYEESRLLDPEWLRLIDQRLETMKDQTRPTYQSGGEFTGSAGGVAGTGVTWEIPVKRETSTTTTAINVDTRSSVPVSSYSPQQQQQPPPPVAPRYLPSQSSSPPNYHRSNDPLYNHNPVYHHEHVRHLRHDYESHHHGGVGVGGGDLNRSSSSRPVKLNEIWTRFEYKLTIFYFFRFLDIYLK